MNERPQHPRKPKARERSGAPAADMPRLDVEAAERGLKEYLGQTVKNMNLTLEYEITVNAQGQDGNGPDVVVAFRGEDEPLLLENDAELLLALEYIGHRWLKLSPRLHDRVRFDCGDFRATQLDELKLSARVAAQRVRETGEAFRFKPMSPRERRIIHLELTGAAGVRTMSEGMGERRQLVIYPATPTPHRKYDQR